jgi:hypothetical protein
MQPIIGPVEYLVVGFPGNQFRGEIVPALTALLDQGMIRILDLAIISKDADGTVLLFEAGELHDEVSQSLALIEGEHEAMLSEADLLMAAEDLEYNTTAAALLFENVWAGRFAQAVRNADGEVLVNVRIPYHVVEAVQELLVAPA